ncbi:ABC transporter substrate binding protein [Syntrophotalea carbinolica]|nr:ABC transporter substrate binding protein [Syntrophotalea carbinolica]
MGIVRFFIILAVLFALPWNTEAARKEKILVLHSYHQGLEWTDSITAGIQSVFKPLDKTYELYYEYLDTKRNTGNDYDKKLTELFAAKIKNIQFKAVIIADNNALAFIKKVYRLLNGHPPIVFCGINHFQPDLMENLPFVTGVTEETDIAANLDLMLRLHPERKRIVVILDKTTTGNAMKKVMTEFVAQYRHRVQIEFLRDFTLEEAASLIAALGPDDMVCLLTFNRDRNNHFISYSEGIALLVEASKVPIYGPWDFYLGKGIVGGVITSGFEQGEIAAQLALRTLNGENPQNIPVVTGSGTYAMFDDNRLRAFHLDPRRLPENARIINSPPGFYERHHRILQICGLLAIVLLAYCCWRLFSQKRERDRLVEMNFALDRLVEEKTACLKETNQVLRRIAITDDLTGLYNRGYLLKQLAGKIETAECQSGNLSTLLLDLDNFKWINDTFGHDFGDTVLEKASAIFRSCLRGTDLVGRYGGEEFLVILPDTDLEKGQLIAEGIRKSIQSCRWDRENFRITISGGLVQYAGESVEMLLKRADKLLYQAKDLGRNRIENRLRKPDDKVEESRIVTPTAWD